MNEITQSTMSFDRMRTMLVRAAEIRESEQQQIFDTLDEIHGRLAPLEAVGSMRKRLADLPDRTEIGVLAERLDETVAKLEANETAVASVARAVDGVVDKLAKPFAELNGRLDGVAGRFEGVAGRMDGLEDKLSNIHRRLDELEVHLDKQDNKVEALPREIGATLKERMEALDSALSGRFADMDASVRDRVDAMVSRLAETRDELGNTKSELQAELGSTQAELRAELGNTKAELQTELESTKSELGAARTDLSGRIAAGTEELQGALAETTDVLHGKLAETHAAATDGARFQGLGERIEQVAGTIEAVSARLDGVESDMASRLGGLSTELAGVRETVTSRPDAGELDALVRKANTESEQRNAGQLDEAMATFAELILGGSANMGGSSLPKQQTRRRTTKARTNGTAGGNSGHGDTDDETA